MQVTLSSFTEAAAAGYNRPKMAPYHNWCHGVDVTHTVHRELLLTNSELFLGSFDRFALIVSAVCHDIGHPGLNNPFLVETGHELAVRYNDHSPLENMHCAKLFQLLAQEKTNVFGRIEKA